MGEVILEQHQPGNTFYILYEGEVSVVKDGVEQTRLRAILGTAHISGTFGGNVAEVPQKQVRALSTESPKIGTALGAYT